MPRTISTSSFARFASAALLAAAAAVGVVALRDQPAEACGWSAPTIEELTTFDPAVAADPTPASLAFDPFVGGFGGACEDCGGQAMRADWDGWLAGAVPSDDWQQLLFQASVPDLERIAGRIGARGRGGPGGGKPAPLPLDLDPGRWKLPAAKAKIVSALAYLAVARGSEQLAGYEASGAAPAEIERLLASAQAGLKKTKDPFLAQRYAFQIVRIRFYQRDWAGVVAFFDRNSARLARPSADLAWRARYYAAGALRRSGALARANVELARVHAGSPALAPAAAQDFQPMEDADWKAALRLARTPREQAQLWRLVGIKQDGVAAAQEIVKLEPTSDLLGLLLVREVARAESTGRMWGDAADAAAVSARQKVYAAIEQLATTIAATRGADRPWLMRLIAGHMAAQRGDVAAARRELAAAVAGRPGDVRVASQARASLALALASDVKLDAAREDELARAMAAIDPGYGRTWSVRAEVRRRLAAAYVKAGRAIDAEFLVPSFPEAGHGSLDAAGKWADVAFLRELIARAGKTTTAFDRFLLDSSYTRADLERELAMRQLLAGDFAAAQKTYASTAASSSRLGTDPFVTHIVDCHDCDHAAYGSAPWTHASFVARMAELARQAGGKGDAAAQAALALGTGLYNLTWYGNARVILDGTRQATADTRPAERWYRKAFELAVSRELKARAAFYAAKAELHGLLTAAKVDPYEGLEALPVPTTWYPIVKTFADTAYHREILAECGTYRRWAGARPGRRP
jgi:hypothetical protein